MKKKLVIFILIIICMAGGVIFGYTRISKNAAKGDEQTESVRTDAAGSEEDSAEKVPESSAAEHVVDNNEVVGGSLAGTEVGDTGDTGDISDDSDASDEKDEAEPEAPSDASGSTGTAIK